MRQRRYWVKKNGVNYIVQILKENFTVVQWRQRARVFMILVFFIGGGFKQNSKKIFKIEITYNISKKRKC